MNRVFGTPLALAAVTALGLALSTDAATAAPAPQHHAKHGVRGDFDGDGKRDLAIGAPLADLIQIRYTHARPGGSRTKVMTANADSATNLMYFGTALAAGDFDDDGYSDLAVGAPGFQPTPQNEEMDVTGAVFVLYGSRTGLHHAPLTIPGANDRAELGGSLAAGDINADGYTDLAAPRGGDLDGIKVYFGSKSGLTPSAETDLGMGHGFQTLGVAIADVNGDGFPDVIGANHVPVQEDTESGTVRVWNGRRPGIATQPQVVSASRLGVVNGFARAVASGDIDGDGYADVVIGNPYDRHAGIQAGSIIVLYGSRHGLSAVRAIRINAHVLNSHVHDDDYFGTAVDIAKVTGDRYADVVVSAPGDRVAGHSSAGVVYLLRGSAHGVVHQHPQRLTLASAHIPGAAHAHDGFGEGVYLGQHVGSSNADLLVWSVGAGNGSLLRFTGTDAGLSTQGSIRITSAAPNGHFGAAVA